MEILKNIALFHHIDKKYYDHVLRCLNGSVKTYEKEESLHIQDKRFKALVVLDGKIDVISRNAEGRVTIHSRYMNGDTLILWQIDENKDIVSKKTSKVLHLDTELIFSDTRNNCTLRKMIMENMIRIQNRQNYLMNCKVEIYTEKSLRNKIMMYLRNERVEEKKPIQIPFNRLEFASYLSCDRCALSRELSTMQDEGLIRVNKNLIYVLD